jgi:hypothetical protein
MYVDYLKLGDVETPNPYVAAYSYVGTINSLRNDGVWPNIQAITISQMLYDPITKGLLVKFGGLDLAGYYEMANRLVVQLRGFIVSVVRF